MTEFVQLLLTGLANGGVYALVALGFALIFGVSNVLNIAHAQTIMLAPALVVVLTTTAGLATGLSVVLGFALTVVIAVLMHLVGVQPMLNRQGATDHLAPLIATFGLTLIVEHGMAKVIGTTGTGFPVELPRTVWTLPGGIRIDPVSALSLVGTALVVVSLAYLVSRTNFGRAMRAVAENAEIAESLGVSATATIIWVTVLAGALGAGAGLLFAAGTNTVTPFMGLTYGLIGLIALIVGGVTSPTGAVLAALVIGVLQSMVNGYVSTNYSDVITFSLLIVILLARPAGLLSIATREARP